VKVGDSTIDTMPLGIRRRHPQSFMTNIYADTTNVTPLFLQLNRERYRQASRTNPEIHTSNRARAPEKCESLFNEQL
jgi:hypothetical protein